VNNSLLISHLALIGVRVPLSKVSKISASQCPMPQRMSLLRFPFIKNLSRSGTFKNLTKKLIKRQKTVKCEEFPITKEKGGRENVTKTETLINRKSNAEIIKILSQLQKAVWGFCTDV
jgi:hypothetical protein